VHPDYKSHTGAVMMIGKGTVMSASTKQKVNTASTTESELVAGYEVVTKALWSMLFMKEQGYERRAVLKRDNMSDLKLEINGKASSSKRSRHYNIKYFYITDLVKRGEIEVQYCATDVMWADYNTKPLVGSKFAVMRRIIMGWMNSK